MNQRIQELEDQCWEDTSVDIDYDYLSRVRRVFNRQKFAQLIVKECLEIALAQKQWVEEQDVFGERDCHWNKARIQQSQRIVDKVKEHFGVKE
jgi:hypothetical protein